MPVELFKNPERALLAVRYAGPVTPANLLDALSFQYEDADFPHFRRTLVDFRGGELWFNQMEIAAVAARLEALVQRAHPGRRVAYLGEKPRHTAYAMMLSPSLARGSADACVFTTEAGAQDFLGLEPGVLRQVLSSEPDKRFE
jgi:hypothetical protein